MLWVDGLVSIAFLMTKFKCNQNLFDYLYNNLQTSQFLIIIKLMKSFPWNIFKNNVKEVVLIEILDYLHNIWMI